MERTPLYFDFHNGLLKELQEPDYLTPGGVKIFQYTADGTEGDEFTIEDLADKNIIGVFRATTYKRAISTTPTTTDYVGIEGTDNGANGILATGGVNLMSGDGLIEGEMLEFIYT
jgi:hypothetical protein